MLQFLIPGVEDAEKADLSAEALGVGGYFDQSLGTAAEQQSIEESLVLQSQGRQLVGESEDHMGVASGQQFGAACVEPLVARLTLAFRAVPVSTGVEGNGSMPASGALIDVATHGCGATTPDGVENFEMQPGEPRRR